MEPASWIVQAAQAWGPIAALVAVVWLHVGQLREDRQLRAQEALARSTADRELASSQGALAEAVAGLQATIATGGACRGAGVQHAR